MSQINSIMSTRFTTTGSLRQIQSQQNTKVNGALFDFRFTPDSTYLAGDKFAILKNCFVDLLLRQGGNPSGGGGSEPSRNKLQGRENRARRDQKNRKEDNRKFSTRFRLSSALR